MEVKKYKLEEDPCIYFRNFSMNMETKLSRSAAISVCSLATEKGFWILGIDVGIINENGKYHEDYNEGWNSKINKLEKEEKNRLDAGFAEKAKTDENNISASRELDRTSSEFNAFIITAKRVIFI